MKTQCSILNCANDATYQLDAMVCSDMSSLATWTICSDHIDDIQLYQNEI